MVNREEEVTAKEEGRSGVRMPKWKRKSLTLVVLKRSVPKLEKLAGAPSVQRHRVAGRRRRVEVAMRAAIALVL